MQEACALQVLCRCSHGGMSEPPDQNEVLQSPQADALQEPHDQNLDAVQGMLHCRKTCLHGVVVTVIVEDRGILC